MKVKALYLVAGIVIGVVSTLTTQHVELARKIRSQRKDEKRRADKQQAQQEYWQETRM